MGLKSLVFLPEGVLTTIEISKSCKSRKHLRVRDSSLIWMHYELLE